MSNTVRQRTENIKNVVDSLNQALEILNDAESDHKVFENQMDQDDYRHGIHRSLSWVHYAIAKLYKELGRIKEARKPSDDGFMDVRIQERPQVIKRRVPSSSPRDFGIGSDDSRTRPSQEQASWPEHEEHGQTTLPFRRGNSQSSTFGLQRRLSVDEWLFNRDDDPASGEYDERGLDAVRPRSEFEKEMAMGREMYEPEVPDTDDGHENERPVYDGESLEEEMPSRRHSTGTTTMRSTSGKGRRSFGKLDDW